MFEPEFRAGTPTIDILDALWAKGQYALAGKIACGMYVEACCTALHDLNSPEWGYVKQTSGTHHYNGHAVDRVQCLTGADNGLWQIVANAVSVDAKPTLVRLGNADPALWYYPA